MKAFEAEGSYFDKGSTSHDPKIIIGTHFCLKIKISVLLKVKLGLNEDFST